MEWYEELANAIIIQAVRDYRKALKILHKNPKSVTAMDEAVDYERFFRSRWFSDMTSLSGELLMEKLKEEIGV